MCKNENLCLLLIAVMVIIVLTLRDFQSLFGDFAFFPDFVLLVLVGNVTTSHLPVKGALSPVE